MALKNVVDPLQAQVQLGAWLASRLSDPEGLTVRDVAVSSSSGLSCETVIFTACWRHAGTPHSRRLVARVAPGPGTPSLFEEYDLAREARIMTALGQHTPVPVPKVLFEETDLAVLGGPFLVMELIAGRVLPDDPPYTREGWVLGLEPAQQRRLVERSVDALAAIHAVSWRALGLDELEHASPGATGIDRYIARIEQLYETGRHGLRHPSIEAGIAWARDHRVADEGEMVLNWGDARPGNLLFDEGLEVVGVLDWEMASIGAREQDLGYMLFSDELFTIGLGGLPNPAGFPTEDEIVAQYERATGHEVRNLTYYKTLAALMGAAIHMRVGWLMIEAGLLPPDSPMRHNNPASHMLNRYLGRPELSGSLTNWTGVR
jgi:aminoglycoside phosphotransferase (APT) family kinase protein